MNRNIARPVVKRHQLLIPNAMQKKETEAKRGKR